MNATSISRLALLAPQASNRFYEMDKQCLALSVPVHIEIVQGGRTVAEQDALFAKGRTVMSDVPCVHQGVARALGTCEQHPLGLTVTAAKGGYSWHNFFMAGDVAPDKLPDAPGFQPDWDESHDSWKKLEQIGKDVGFECGAGWSLKHRDAPHFQFVGRFATSPSDEVRQLFKDGGLKAVWESAFG